MDPRFRYDDNGKQVGLAWPVRDEAPVVPKPKVKVKKKRVLKVNPLYGKPASGQCKQGHDQTVHGRRKKSGSGTYCRECNRLRASEYRAQGKQKEYRRKAGLVKGDSK